MNVPPGAPDSAPKETFFEGHKDRECGEHRTVGYRAWCFDCHEWCYPKVELACKGCELPALRAEIARLKSEPCSGACLLKLEYVQEDPQIRELLMEP